MKLIDGLKLKGRPAEIPDNLRDDLPQFFVDMGYKVGAEIGVAKGLFSEKFCRLGLKMYAIDPWVAYTGAGRRARRQDAQDHEYGHAQRLLAPYPNCTIIKKTSVDAAKDFRGESLDFVYLDGDHRFPAVAEDIYEWYYRIKKGGVISGHDYFCTDPWAANSICQVSVIVDAFVKAMRIENFYVFGSQDHKAYLSWMFIKP